MWDGGVGDGSGVGLAMLERRRRMESSPGILFESVVRARVRVGSIGGVGCKYERFDENPVRVCVLQCSRQHRKYRLRVVKYRPCYIVAILRRDL